MIFSLIYIFSIICALSVWHYACSSCYGQPYAWFHDMRRSVWTMAWLLHILSRTLSKTFWTDAENHESHFCTNDSLPFTYYEFFPRHFNVRASNLSIICAIHIELWAKQSLLNLVFKIGELKVWRKKMPVVEIRIIMSSTVLTRCEKRNCRTYWKHIALYLWQFKSVREIICSWTTDRELEQFPLNYNHKCKFL